MGGLFNAVEGKSGESIYSFEVRNAGIFTFDTCKSAALKDTVISLYTSDMSSRISTNDDNRDHPCYQQSKITRTLQPAKYSVLVRGYSDKVGQFVLSVRCL